MFPAKLLKTSIQMHQEKAEMPDIDVDYSKNNLVYVWYWLISQNAGKVE